MTAFPSDLTTPLPLFREHLKRHIDIDPDSVSPQQLAMTLAKVRENDPARNRYLPAGGPGRGRAGRKRSGDRHPACLLRHRGDHGNPSEHPGRGQRSLRNPLLLQFEEIQPEAHRHLPCPARGPGQIDLQVELDPRHGPFLRGQPFSGRVVGNHRGSGQPARTDREHQGRPGEGRPGLRGQEGLFWHQRHLHVQQDRGPGDHAGRGTSCWSTGTATSPTTTASSWPALSPCTWRPFPWWPIRCTAACRSGRSRRPCSTSRPKGSSTGPKSSTSPTAPSTATCTITRRVMEECLAIKPDLIFLWDEAWFGFAAVSPHSIAEEPPWVRRDFWRHGIATLPIVMSTKRSKQRPGSLIRRMQNCLTCISCPTRTRCGSGFTRPIPPTNQCPRSGRDR